MRPYPDSPCVDAGEYVSFYASNPGDYNRFDIDGDPVEFFRWPFIWSENQATYFDIGADEYYVPGIRWIDLESWPIQDEKAIKMAVYAWEPMSELTIDDLRIVTTGTLTGTTITQVAPPTPSDNISGDLYKIATVPVDAGEGEGEFRLDVLDYDRIISASGVPLGGPGLRNGDYVWGASIRMDHTSPSAVIEQAPGQADPCLSLPIAFDITFNEMVYWPGRHSKFFKPASVRFIGTAPVLDWRVSGEGLTYRLEVTRISGPGTVIPILDAGAAIDQVGLPSLESGGGDNSVMYIRAPGGSAVDKWGLY